MTITIFISNLVFHHCVVIEQVTVTIFFLLQRDETRKRKKWQGCQVPKNKKAKFGHKQFQKRSNFEIGKKTKFSKKIYQNISNKFWNIIKCCMFCLNLTKVGLKRYSFLQDWKKPNGQIILFLKSCFKKGQFGNP